jgi:hypothetical protein
MLFNLSVHLIKKRSPLTNPKPDRLFPIHQTAIAPHTHKTDRLNSTSNSDRLNSQDFAFKLVYNQAVGYIFTLQR